MHLNIRFLKKEKKSVVILFVIEHEETWRNRDTKHIPHYSYRLGSHRAVNTFHLHYLKKKVNALYGNSRSFPEIQPEYWILNVKTGGL
jgi:hypothetical protein